MHSRAGLLHLLVLQSLKLLNTGNTYFWLFFFLKKKKVCSSKHINVCYLQKTVLNNLGCYWSLDKQEAYLRIKSLVTRASQSP